MKNYLSDSFSKMVMEATWKINLDKWKSNKCAAADKNGAAEILSRYESRMEHWKGKCREKERENECEHLEIRVICTATHFKTVKNDCSVFCLLIKQHSIEWNLVMNQNECSFTRKISHSPFHLTLSLLFLASFRFNKNWSISRQVVIVKNSIDQLEVPL